MSSFTRVPVVLSVLSPGQEYNNAPMIKAKSSREKVSSLRADLSNNVRRQGKHVAGPTTCLRISGQREKMNEVAAEP